MATESLNTLILKQALSKIGIREFSGRPASPTILGWIKQFYAWATDDEINWCSVFAYNCAVEAVAKLDSTKQLKGAKEITPAARTWLRYGEPTGTPEMGDVVIFWRESPSSWKGHVGFFIRENRDYIFVLGGNQNNEVNITPYLKSRVLGYRKHVLL